MQIRNAKQLGAMVRARRKPLKITQRALAMTCGTGLRFISDLENGKPTCHLGKTLEVLWSLGLDLRAEARDGKPLEGDQP